MKSRQSSRTPDGARTTVHGDGHPDHFGDLGHGGSSAGGSTGVSGNTAVTLAGNGDSQRDELLYPHGQRTFGHGGHMERIEPGDDVGNSGGQFLVGGPQIILHLVKMFHDA